MVATLRITDKANEPRGDTLYGGVDPRSLPAYSLSEVAQYTGVPVATLKSWVFGRSYPTTSGVRLFKPIIEPPESASTTLSFLNLVEVHVLAAIRRQHRVPLNKVRTALDYLQKVIPSPHPLAD